MEVKIVGIVSQVRTTKKNRQSVRIITNEGEVVMYTREGEVVALERLVPVKIIAKLQCSIVSNYANFLEIVQITVEK